MNRTTISLKILSLGTLLLLSSVVSAEPLSFSKAKKELVKYYKTQTEATTFYCGCEIAWEGKKGSPVWKSCGYTPRIAITRSGKENQRAKRIEWEHVMPAYWFGHQRQCWQEGGRKACKKDPQFVEMEGDLHNLQPAIGELNGDRSNYRFSLLEGEERRYGACNFEVDFKARKAEPPENVQGDIARTYLYMADKYNLTLSSSQRRLFDVWSQQDPVDDWERQRNRWVGQVQGNINPYIQ